MKSNISDDRALVWYADHLHMLYTFELCIRKMKKKEKEEQNQDFHVGDPQL